VARIEVATEVADDLDRIVDHLTQHDASRIDKRITKEACYIPVAR